MEAHESKKPRKTGWKWSAEARARQSERMRGKPVSEETRKLISIALLGRKRSPETRQNISAARRGVSRPRTRKAVELAVANRTGIRVEDLPAYRGMRAAGYTINEALVALGYPARPKRERPQIVRAGTSTDQQAATRSRIRLDDLPAYRLFRRKRFSPAEARAMLGYPPLVEAP